MPEQLRDEKVVLGGLAFLAGLLAGKLFRAVPLSGNSGCSGNNQSSTAAPSTMGGLAGPGGPVRHWWFCTAGGANYCTGTGIGVTPDGVAHPLPGTTCTFFPELEGLCGEGDYFLTIPQTVA